MAHSLMGLIVKGSHIPQHYTLRQIRCSKIKLTEYHSFGTAQEKNINRLRPSIAWKS